MKLLVDCHVFDGKFQGTRTYLEGLYSNLVKHSDIDFFFAAQNVELLEKIFGKRKNTHFVRLQTGSGMRRLFKEFPKIVSDYGIEYAHYQYISPWKKSCKEIVTCHDLLFIDMPRYFPLSFRMNKGFFFKRSAKRADILLTVSEYSKNALVRHFGIPSENIYITPNAVLPIANHASHLDVKTLFGVDKYILTVSRIEPRKNHLSLLRAFAELKLYDDGYKLVMIGSLDFDNSEFISYLNGLPPQVKDSVIIKSASFEELVELYKNASLFVFPSYAEGFGIPPLEAIEYGCPLLCSCATAMAEFDFPEQISFNPNNFEELKAKIIQELANPMDLSLVREKIRSKFNWEKISDQFYDVLKDCMRCG